MPDWYKSIFRNRLVLAGLLIVLAAIVLKDRLPFGPSYDGIYNEYRRILSQAKELAARDAGDAEWAAFKQDSVKRLKPIVDELQELCDRRPALSKSAFGSVSPDRTTQFIRQPLLQIGRYGLPKVIENGCSRKPLQEAPVEQQLQAVQSALDAIRLGSSGQGEQGT